MSHETFFIYLILMAVSTYLIRVIPFISVKKIENIYIRSFLTYIPYAVLTAMTIPAILYATDNIVSAAVGLVGAVCMAIAGFGLMPVAVVACLCVYITEFVIGIM